MSIITQSGGVGLMLWNLMTDENIGMAKFASIGNKLDLDEVDFLEYLGHDPETKIIGMYLESMPRGSDMAEMARKIEKPIVIFKSNTTSAGRKAAMSHTAALSNDDDIIDAAFEGAGIIRIRNFSDFMSVAKAFDLPPMRGNRIMVMSPAGGFSVMMADLCEKIGIRVRRSRPGVLREPEEFLQRRGHQLLQSPGHGRHLRSEHVRAHLGVGDAQRQRGRRRFREPVAPDARGEDVFYSMFHTDLSKEANGTMLSSGKPLGICLFGLAGYMHQVKQSMNFPIFNSPEEMVRALAFQRNYHAKKREKLIATPALIDTAAAKAWLDGRNGSTGEDSLELLKICGLPVAESRVAKSAGEAANSPTNSATPW